MLSRQINDKDKICKKEGQSQIRALTLFMLRGLQAFGSIYSHSNITILKTHQRNDIQQLLIAVINNN